MQFYILAPRAAPDLITIREASNKISSFATMKSSMLCTTQEKWMSGNSDYGDSFNISVYWRKYMLGI
jgi:hypothetical protein